MVGVNKGVVLMHLENSSLIVFEWPSPSTYHILITFWSHFDLTFYQLKTSENHTHSFLKFLGIRQLENLRKIDSWILGIIYLVRSHLFSTSPPPFLIRTITCAYQGGKMLVFRKDFTNVLNEGSLILFKGIMFHTSFLFLLP